MTTSRAASLNESLLIGLPSSPAGSPGAEVISREFSAARPLPLPNTHALDSLLGHNERSPERAALMAAARRALNEAVYSGEQGTLTSLRLAAGMSQAQLAERVGTSQSHIARIERGQNDPSTGVVERIANALGVDAPTAFQAILRQRESFGECA